jgi:hypothetical protein
LRAGEALQRVLLEIARAAYAAVLSTSVIEVAATRIALQNELSLTMRPHLLLHLGRRSVRQESC